MTYQVFYETLCFLRKETSPLALLCELRETVIFREYYYDPYEETSTTTSTLLQNKSTKTDETVGHSVNFIGSFEFKF